MVVNEQPADKKRRWFAHIEIASHRSKLPNLIELNEWLQEESLVPERKKLQQQNIFQKLCIEENKIASDQVDINKKNSTFTNDRKIRFQKCPLDDGKHPLWKFDKFKSLSITEPSETVKHAKLCVKCLMESIAPIIANRSSNAK